MYLKKLILSTLVYLFFGNMAFAQSLPSVELINNAKKYDGTAVVYSGEVIGDVMKRGENAWVNVNDGANAIGVWVDSSIAQDLIFKGGYKARGDKVEVYGIFHSSCPQHGGDLDIHANKLFVVAAGENTAEPLSIKKRNIAFVLVSFAFALWLIQRKV